MVSSGTVSGHSSELEQNASNYMSQIEGLASSWKGSSHDSIAEKCSEFYSQMKQVVSQLLAFADAVSLYEQYKEYKDKYQSASSAYNQLPDTEENRSARSQYMSTMNECEAKMKELAEKIRAALANASGFKMEASASSDATTPTETATEETTSTDTAKKGESTTGGEFIANPSNGVFGQITTSLDGTTHIVYNQMQIAGWSGDCNRAAASSIASGFASNNTQAVDIAKKAANGIGYKEDVTNQYFSNFGLQATVHKVNGKYDSVKGNIVSALQNGDYVMFDLANPTVGKSGQRWTFKRHWVSVLDMKRTGDGPNDYAIFVSDSAHHGSETDHGLGTGWYSIDEFTGQTIANYTTVSSSGKPA